MKRPPQWILLLKVCSLVFALSYSTQLIAAETKEHPVRKLANDNLEGYIGIDCGAEEDYTDGNTSISYKSDASFVSTGENHVTSPDHSFEESFFKKQLNSLRSFPDGTKNCYTLKPNEGKNNRYQITALFAYGNYDNNDKIPVFVVYLGVNYWDTIDLDDSDDIYHLDAFYVAAYDSVDVCLLNTGSGTPIISLLELQLFRDSIYETESNSLPLDLMERGNLGSFEYGGDFVRYTDDIYKRIWLVPDDFTGQTPFNTPAAFSIDGINDDFKLPRAVLSTAVHAVNLSSSLDIYGDYDTSYEYIVYLHFFEFEEQAQNLKKRIIDIAFNGQSILQEPLTLAYWKPQTIPHSVKLEGNNDDIHISITATPESDLPAMLNAYEIYRILPQPNSTTAQEDVDALWDIKRIYKIPRKSWRGDPCVPKSSNWEGLDCSSDNIPRVTSLNLSSSNLTGGIAASFFNLKKLRSLDLSNNELTGEIPEFLAELPDLHSLNLTRNKLTGSIPKALKEKSNTTFLLSLDGNPGLCQTDSCTSEKHKSVVPLAALVAGAVAFLMIIVIFSYLMMWRLRLTRKKQGVMSRKDEQLKLKGRTFSYAEIQSITDNFNVVVGKGGFGCVYLGALQDSRQVAVKILSNSSMQGVKEFQSEAQLLILVHHRNLVPLVGYCNEGDIKALVYEYMVMGNLQQQLSDKNPNALKWKKRIQIALDVAHGLDYLHNGCKPSIVHRDLKSSNILLNEDLQAKIADFGLSRVFAKDIDTYISTNPSGTPGYLDPEFQSSGKLNKKSDVYSFGIILQELLTGQPAMKGTASGNINHILSWVTPKLESGDIQSIVDPRLQGTIDSASAWKFVEIAISCTPPTAIQRPDIAEIVSELKECLALEIATERTESNRGKSSYTQDISVLQLDSEISGPSAR